jgi:hypothetical protein
MHRKMKGKPYFIAASAAGVVTMLSGSAGASTCDNAGWCRICRSDDSCQYVAFYVRSLRGAYNRRLVELTVVNTGVSSIPPPTRWLFDCSRSTYTSDELNVAAVMGSLPAIPDWGEEVLKHVCQSK